MSKPCSLEEAACAVAFWRRTPLCCRDGSADKKLIPLLLWKLKVGNDASRRRLLVILALWFGRRMLLWFYARPRSCNRLWSSAFKEQLKGFKRKPSRHRRQINKLNSGHLQFATLRGGRCWARWHWWSIKAMLNQPGPRKRSISHRCPVKCRSHTLPFSLNQHMTVQHPSCQHFYFGNVFVAKGSVRSGFPGNCQPPVPLQLNTLFHRHGSGEALVSQGTRGVREGMWHCEREGEGKQVLWKHSNPIWLPLCPS